MINDINLFREINADYSGEIQVKVGIFTKKYPTYIRVNDKYVMCGGFSSTFLNKSAEYTEKKEIIAFDDIIDIKIINTTRYQSIEIKYKVKSSIGIRDLNLADSIVIPNLKNIDVCYNKLIEMFNDTNNKIRVNKEQMDLLENKIKMENERKKQEIQEHYDKCKSFHLLNDNNPYFTILDKEYKFACVYIDKDKNFNFLVIDSEKLLEDNAIIPFCNIHYYEKAGNIHYTTSIAGSYQSYGGSFTGGNISKGWTGVSALLFGTFGLLAGAALTYKPAEYIEPTQKYDLKSDINKIDERNVMLNYYSDVKKQYIDIQLPADIYNFLQTYLPEKKYNIVNELEKQTAIKKYGEQINNGTYTSISQESSNTNFGEINDNQNEDRIQNSDEIDEFSKKVKKLKLMYDNGLLSEDEFKTEKSKLLLEI